jgi:hypothetical protein
MMRSLDEARKEYIDAEKVFNELRATGPLSGEMYVRATERVRTAVAIYQEIDKIERDKAIEVAVGK